MQPKYANIIERICLWSQQMEEIKGTVIIGSQVRDDLQADQWSDLDLMVLVHTPEAFLSEEQWLDRFGNVVCAFNYITPLHFVSWDWCVKRALFDDNRDVDFSILPYDHVDEVLAVNQGIMAKGYLVLYDAQTPLLETKISALVAANDDSPTQPPTENELHNTINDLLFHVVWAFKKIKRQELWVAVSDINQHISGLLLQLIEWHTVCVTHTSTAIAYEGRFLEKRAAGDILRQLRHCFTTYDPADAIKTLDHLITLTHFIAQDLYQANGYMLSEELFANICALYAAMKDQE